MAYSLIFMVSKKAVITTIIITLIIIAAIFFIFSKKQELTPSGEQQLQEGTKNFTTGTDISGAITKTTQTNTFKDVQLNPFTKENE